MPKKSIEDISYPGWAVTGKLGSGSFGTVYAIERDNFGHKESAALKVISIPQYDEDIEKLREEYADEGSITARFKMFWKM